MILDLHGCTENEAISKILLALLNLENNQHNYLEIITGNGNVLKRTLEDILEEEGYDWKNYSNNGSYIIKAKNKF